MSKRENISMIDSLEFIHPIIRDSLKENGITHLKEFQVRGVKEGLKGKNLIISSPTGSGKTLIGEIISVSRVLLNKEKVLYLVPYKALAEEVKETFSKRYPYIRVGIGTGDYRELPNDLLGKRNDLLIVTYEKADSILRDSPPWLDNLKLIVIDEIHLLGDYDRGPILDIIITRALEKGIQIIGLSATIPNPEEIAKWMKAKLIHNNVRPVKLLEGVYLRQASKIYFYDPDPNTPEYLIVKETEESNVDEYLEAFRDQTLDYHIKSLKVTKTKKITRALKSDEFSRKLEKIFQDQIGKGAIKVDNVERSPLSASILMASILDMVYDLFYKMKNYGQTWQILIFRKSRKLAQSTAKKIVEMMKKSELYRMFPAAKQVAMDLIDSVEEINPLTEELAEYIKYGVAFHHAGLSKEERKIIEDAFRSRKIGVIVATPTLAAGINLPARRVVVEHTMFSSNFWEGKTVISVASYKQRSGRAGRPGLDSVGESVLIAKNKQEIIELFERYVFGEMEPVESYLGVNLPTLREQILALIVSEGGGKKEEITRFFEKTYYYYKIQNNESTRGLFERNVLRSLEDLLRWNFIEKEDEHYQPTRVGVAVSKLYLDPLTATTIIKMLTKIRTIAQFDPVTVFSHLTKTPDVAYYRIKAVALIRKSSFILNRLPSEYRNILYDYFGEDLLDFLAYYSSSRYRLQLSAEEEIEVASLLLTALLLQWINGIPIKDILSDLTPTIGSGDFIELVRTVERLLFSSRELAKVLRKDKDIINKLEILRKRVEYGVTEELLELTAIPSVGRIRAKILYENGYTSIEKLARASITVLSSLPTIGETTARKIIEYARQREKLK